MKSLRLKRGRSAWLAGVDAGGEAFTVDQT